MTLERECFADSTKGMEAWIKADEMRKALEGAVEAMRLADKWLANCAPVVRIEGPTPLPALAKAIAAGEEALK